MAKTFDIYEPKGTVKAFSYIVAIGLFMLVTLGMTLAYFYKSKQLDVEIAEINLAPKMTIQEYAKKGWK